MQLGATLNYSYGNPYPSGGWIYTPITITNFGSETVHALSNVAIVNTSYAVVGTSTLGTDAGCGVINLLPKASVNCSIIRRGEIPFSNFLITWFRTHLDLDYKSSPTPTPASNFSRGEICTTSSGRDQCSPIPIWNQDMCSALSTGVLQQKMVNKWVTITKVIGKKDSTQCAQIKWPFLIHTSGVWDSSSQVQNWRISFTGTKQISGFVWTFSVHPKL